MVKSQFRSVSLSAGLVEEIKKFVARNQRYKSVAEFVGEAVRFRLDDLDEMHFVRELREERKHRRSEP